MLSVIEMIKCDNDPRFTIFFDRNEKRFNVVYLPDEIVFGSDKYPDCLKWVFTKGYVSFEKYLEEM